MFGAIWTEWRSLFVPKGGVYLVLMTVAVFLVAVAVGRTSLLDDPPVPALIIVFLACVGANRFACFATRVVERHRRDRRPEGSST